MNIRKSWNWWWQPPVDGPRATLLLRAMAGGVFLWEGIMKFIYPSLGAVLHDIRSDYAQRIVSLFLLKEGADRWSLDALHRKNQKARHTLQGYGHDGEDEVKELIAEYKESASKL